MDGGPLGMEVFTSKPEGRCLPEGVQREDLLLVPSPHVGRQLFSGKLESYLLKLPLLLANANPSCTRQRNSKRVMLPTLAFEHWDQMGTRLMTGFTRIEFAWWCIAKMHRSSSSVH